MGIDEKVCILGIGYVGLTLAVAMAKGGFLVHGVEIDEKKLELVKMGKPHFHEPGLESALKTEIGKGALTFSREMPRKPYPVYVITVGTPLSRRRKIPRFDMVRRVSRQISDAMNQKSLVILRSTVAVGTSRNVVLPILEQRIEQPQVAYCSERTLEGKALEEIFTLPQVIGAVDERSLRRASSLFHRIAPTVVEVSSLETAEMIKLIDNVCRDVQFALANEMAEVCEILGIDAYETIRAANLGYSRTNVALPGYVGGPCLEKDPYILRYSLKNAAHKPKITMAARSLHEKLQGRIADRILRWTLDKKLRPESVKVTLLGMAFKGIPETDDLRGAPSVIMVGELRSRGYRNICGHDYLVSDDDIEKLNIRPVDIANAFDGASVVVLMNNNPLYKEMNLIDAIGRMSRPAYFMDSWNIFAFSDFPSGHGVYYGSIGRR